jgi:hypothetical protein
MHFASVEECDEAYYIITGYRSYSIAEKRRSETPQTAETMRNIS